MREISLEGSSVRKLETSSQIGGRRYVGRRQVEWPISCFQVNQRRAESAVNARHEQTPMSDSLSWRLGVSYPTGTMVSWRYNIICRHRLTFISF